MATIVESRGGIVQRLAPLKGVQQTTAERMSTGLSFDGARSGLAGNRLRIDQSGQNGRFARIHSFRTGVFTNA